MRADDSWFEIENYLRTLKILSITIKKIAPKAKKIENKKIKTW